MIQILGAIFVGLGCICLGEAKARELTRRRAALESIRSALEQLERELELRLTPLPQLMEELGQRASPPASGLFQGCRQALETLDRESFAQAWVRLVEQMPDLKEEDRRVLAPLGQVLGRYDGRGQAEAIAQLCRTLERLSQDARMDSARLGKVYRAVGAAGGGFLVILLL